MDRPERDRMDALGELLRDAVPPPSRLEHLEGRARLIAQVVAMRRPDKVRVYTLVAAVLAAITVAMMAAAATGKLRAPWSQAAPAGARAPGVPPQESAMEGPAPQVIEPSEPSQPPADLAESVPPASPETLPKMDLASAAPSPAPARISWRELVARGESQRVVREAKALGLDNVLRTRPVSDLRALGDAIRYTGSASPSASSPAAGSLDARPVYEAIRRRFPTSNDAHVSAFVLGRLSEEQAGRPDDAIAWYSTYLREAGAGPFAGDALGRKMMLVARRSGQREARSLAMEYLRLYPHGSYEKPALDLIR